MKWGVLLFPFMILGSWCRAYHFNVEESYRYNWSVSVALDATQPLPHWAVACDTPVMNFQEEMGLQMKVAQTFFEYPYAVSFNDRLPMDVQQDVNLFFKIFQDKEWTNFVGVRFQNIFTPLNASYEYYDLATFVVEADWPALWLSENLILAVQLNYAPRSLLYSEELDDFFLSRKYVVISSLVGEFP